MICSNAGPLGREVTHPGPIGFYTWEGLVMPVWAGEIILKEFPTHASQLVPQRSLW